MPSIQVEDGDVAHVMRFLKEQKQKSDRGSTTSSSTYGRNDYAVIRDKKGHSNKAYDRENGHDHRNGGGGTMSSYQSSDSNNRDKINRLSEKNVGKHDVMYLQSLERSPGMNGYHDNRQYNGGSSMKSMSTEDNRRNLKLMNNTYDDEGDRRWGRRRRKGNKKCHWWAIFIVVLILLLIGALVGIMILMMSKESADASRARASEYSAADNELTKGNQAGNAGDGGENQLDVSSTVAPALLSNPTVPLIQQPGDTSTTSAVNGTQDNPYGGYLLLPDGRSERYLAVAEAVGWATALRRCHAIHTHLAVMESMDELDKLSAELFKLESLSDGRSKSTNFYIGGLKLHPSAGATFFWYTNGEPVNELMWAENEPNYAGGEELCVGIDAHTAKGKLNDCKCVLDYQYLEGFICEYPDEESGLPF